MEDKLDWLPDNTKEIKELEQREQDKKTMSIFGDLDVNNVSDDPNAIEPNTYWMIATDAKIIERKSDGKPSLVVTWQIDEPGSEFHGKKTQDWLTVNPTPELDWSQLDPKVKNGLKYTKQRMRKAFDFSEAEMNGLNPSDLVGKGAYVTLKKNGDYTNIVNALSKRLYDEENGSNVNSATNTFGL